MNFQSPTIQHLQDTIIRDALGKTHLLHNAAPLILAAERLCEQLKADGLADAHVASQIDGHCATAYVRATTPSIEAVGCTLNTLGYRWHSMSSFHGSEFFTATWSVDLNDVPVALMLCKQIREPLQ